MEQKKKINDRLVTDLFLNLLEPKPSKLANLPDVLKVLPVLVKKCLVSGTVIMEGKDGAREPLVKDELLEL